MVGLKNVLVVALVVPAALLLEEVQMSVLPLGRGLRVKQTTAHLSSFTWTVSVRYVTPQACMLDFV